MDFCVEVPFPSAVSGMVSRALEEVLRTSTLLGWDSNADIPEAPEMTADCGGGGGASGRSPKKPGNLILCSATTVSAPGRTPNSNLTSDWVGAEFALQQMLRLIMSWSIFTLNSILRHFYQ